MAKKEIVDMLSRLPRREIEQLMLRAGVSPATDQTEAIVSHYRQPTGVYDMRRFVRDVTACPKVERAVLRLATIRSPPQYACAREVGRSKVDPQ